MKMATRCQPVISRLGAGAFDVPGVSRRVALPAAIVQTAPFSERK
jgi:hypothetical protein